MHLFENGGNRGHNLELVYQYLLSIPPTSIEPERAFSAAGYLGSKIRSRLNDQTLNALLFLRAYFQTKKESLQIKYAFNMNCFFVLHLLFSYHLFINIK